MTKTTAPEGIKDEPGTAEEQGHVTEPTAKPELVTEWANSTEPENFDHD